MDSFQGITTEIISNDQSLILYNDPDAAEVQESHERHYYVEAMAGCTFQVKVNLTPQFKMKRAQAVYIKVKIDGNFTRTIRCYKTGLQHAFSRGELGGHTFSRYPHFCDETGQWMSSDYSFGNLILEENSISDLPIEQTQDLGKIQVAVQRINIVKRRTPSGPSMAPITMVTGVPEKALKGRQIDTFVGLANTAPTSEPSFDTKRAVAIGGEAGKPVTFNIYYRSRHALQMLGCIPRSPSPAITPSVDMAEEHFIKPEGNSSTTGNSNDPPTAPTTGIAASPDEMMRQIQILNARITDLERLKVKTEASNTNPAIKTEGSGIKRERKDDGGNGGSPQKRRTSIKVEHVDLTDD